MPWSSGATGPPCAAGSLLLPQIEAVLLGKSSASVFMPWFLMGNEKEKEIKLLRVSTSPPHLFPVVNEP